MMGAIPRRDEGFSLIEVMFAAFIAFFVLTALFAVLVSSSSQGRIANMDTMATDLAQLVVEQARAMPYESIGTTTPGEVLGSLQASETTSFQNYTFSIRREIIWIDDPLSPRGPGSHDYKQLTVRVSWKGGHATPIVTYIRDRTNEAPEAPEVKITQGADPYSILYIKSGITTARHPVSGIDSSLPSIQASASANTTEGTITRMEIRVNGVTVQDTVLTGLDSAVVTAYPDTPWPIDLTETQNGVGLFKEGLNVVEVWATASNMGFDYDARVYIVDLDPPTWPDGSTFILTQPEKNLDRFYSKVEMHWTPSIDGTATPVDTYDVEITAEGSSTATAYGSQKLGIAGFSVLTTGAPPLFSPTPFTPYQVRLTPRSPLGNLSTTFLDSEIGCSSPRLQGGMYGYKPGGKMSFIYKLRLSSPKPDNETFVGLFNATSVEYRVYTKSHAGYTYPGKGNLGGTSKQTILPVDPEVAPPSAFDVDMSTVWDQYVQVEAVIHTADGDKSVWSNVIGPPVKSPAHGETVQVGVSP